MGKQPTQGQKKTKDQISKAASQRSKQSKKKWTKGKVKEKLNNAVFLDKASYELISNQLPKIGRLVTVAVLSDKFKINGYSSIQKHYIRSLARKVLTHFTEKGVLQVVGDRHHASTIYTVSAASAAAQAKKDAADPKAQEKGGKAAAGQKGKQAAQK